MRFARLALLLLAAALPARAVDLYPPGWSVIAVSEWGGLNLLNDSTAIGSDAQKAQNVITDNGYLEKRPGNVALGTILSGSANKLSNDWVAPSGTRYLIAHASDTIYQTDLSTTAVILGTVAASASVNYISAFSRIYFADGVAPLWYWDESSTATLVSANGTPAPICTYMAFKDARLFCANIPNDGRSRVRISSTGGAGYWVVPSDVNSVDNAPNVFDFTPDDGDSIQCMATTPWGVFVGKRYSSSMIKGTGNLSHELRILDPKIGCVDNHSVQMVNGVLQWLSVDGVYAFNGAGPAQIISHELDPMFRGLAFSTARSQEWRVDTQAEFQAGNLSVSGPMSTISATVTPGSITPSTFSAVDTSSTDFSAATLTNLSITDTVGSVLLSSRTFRDNFEDGNFTSNPTWTVAGSGNWTIESNKLRFSGDSAPTGIDGSISVPNVDSSSGSWTFDCLSYANGVAGAFTSGDTLTIDFIVAASGTDPATTNGYAARVFLNDNGATTNSIYRLDSGSYVLLSSVTRAAGTNMPTPVTIEKSSGIIRATFGTVSTGSVITANDTAYTGTGNIILRVQSAIPQAGTEHEAITFDNIYWYKYSPVTGSMTSRIFDMTFSTPTFGALNSTFTANNAGGEGNIAFYVQTSTAGDGGGFSSFVSSSDTIKPAVSQRRYARYRADFSTHVSTKSPQLDSIQLTAATTGYYNSSVHFIGSDITSYGQFAVTQNLPNGSTNTYSVRVTTYSFTDTSGVSIPWVSQTANLVPTVSVSTPAYFQWRVLMDFNQADNAPTVSRVALNWDEGTVRPVASGVQDRRYFLCITVSSTATNNDTCIVRQQNRKWVTWTGPSIGSMGLYDNNLIVGDGDTSGKVWKVMQEDVYSDDFAAIDSQWVSADYTNGLVFNDKILHEFWVDAAPVSLSSITISYAVNKSSAYTDYQFYLDNGQPISSDLKPAGIMQHGQINQWVPLLSGFDVGKYVRIKFSDATLSNYFRINTYLLYLENKSRMVPN